MCIRDSNEAAAAALPSVLASRGMSSPADISVIGRYSDEFARTFSLPFSAIDSGADLLGRRAVEQLVARLNDAGAAGSHVVDLIAPIIDDRGSIAAPPTRN